MFAVAAALFMLLALSVLAYGLGVLLGRRGEPVRDWLVHRGRPLADPEGRPIEEIGRDLRRLGARYHGLHPHASFAKVEAVRNAYDRVLAECCTSLGLTHLLGVLPVGPERDAERERVEELLADSGVRFPHPA